MRRKLVVGDIHGSHSQQITDKKTT